MSMLNIVIHMLFASTGVLSVEREVEDKITLWCQQEKSSNEYLNKFPCQLQVVLDVHPSSRSQPILLVLPRFTPLNESNP
jgi:hypothetical protein